ncbi:MAG TPA: DUF4253 domain-containing protein [Phycisphaerales bacterium]|nr:DUF4253 domain-containing protein [Phycisphaerales bacterium]
MGAERTVVVNGVECRVIAVPAARALAEWEQHRRNAAQTGRYPLITDMEAIDSLNEMANGQVTPEYRTDAEQWLELRRLDVEAMLEEDSVEGEVIRGEFTECEYEHPGGPQLLVDTRTGRERTDILILLVPCGSGAEAMEVIGYGGWNDCPTPAAQGAMMRRWLERYGAEPVAIGRDTVECVVKRPPMTEEGSMELAWEHFLYCQDIIEQDTDTVGNLAGMMKGCPWWFFWWD